MTTERVLESGDYVRLLADVPAMFAGMAGASKGQIGQITLTAGNHRSLSVRITSTRLSFLINRELLEHIPPQPFGETERLWLLQKTERDVALEHLVSWAICQRLCHTPSSLKVEFERLHSSGEVARWKRHADYCRTKGAVPTSGIALDLWRAGIDLQAELLRQKQMASSQQDASVTAPVTALVAPTVSPPDSESSLDTITVPTNDTHAQTVVSTLENTATTPAPTTLTPSATSETRSSDALHPRPTKKRARKN